MAHASLPIRETATNELSKWYESFRRDGVHEPDRYVVCAGLAVLEHARGAFPLQRSDYVTPKTQVKTGGPFIKTILARYGEDRPYASEGGRTTRGTLSAAEQLAEQLNALEALAALPHEERIEVIDGLQRWLAERATEFFNQQRIAVGLDPTTPGDVAIADVLVAAGSKIGAVAQHLVGAKLAVRFPEMEIENHSYTTADQQLGRHGDFVVGSTVFHVTVAPGTGVVEKCRANIRNGYRAKLLVREDVVQAARQLVSIAGLDRQVGVASIEAFVGQNIEELGDFDQPDITETLKELFAEYNRRVEEVEIDRSLLLDLPEFLRKEAR
jgi:hypothetical protein